MAAKRERVTLFNDQNSPRNGTITHKVQQNVKDKKIAPYSGFCQRISIWMYNRTISNAPQTRRWAEEDQKWIKIKSSLILARYYSADELSSLFSGLLSAKELL